MINRKNFFYVIKTMLGVGSLIWLIWRIDYTQIASSIGSGNPLFLLYGVLIMSLAFIVIQSIRLHILVRSITNSWIETLKIVLISLFMDQFLPTSMGGDAYKIICLRNIDNSNWAKPVTLAFLDRFVGMGILFAAGMLYLFLRKDWLPSTIREISPVDLTGMYLNEGISLCIGLGLILGLIFRSKIKKMWLKFLSFMNECKKVMMEINFSVWLWVIVLSISFHALRAVGFYCFILYFKEYVSLLDLVFVLFFTAFVSVLPLTIGGLGLIEGAITLSLSIYGVSGSSAIAIAFINRLIWILYAVVGGVCFILTRKKQKFIQ